MGKVLIVKSLAVSKFMYLASLIHIPQDIIKEINSIIYEFIWNGKTHKVKRKIFEQDFNKGGYKMIDFESAIKASKVMWIKNLL